MRQALDSIAGSSNLQSTINNLISTKKVNDPMVNEPELMKVCHNKLIQDGNDFNYKLVWKTRGKVAYRKSYLWYLFVKKNAPPLPNNWRLVDYYWNGEGGCTFFENDKKENSNRLVIDVALSPNGVHIYLFSRNEKNTVSLCQATANKSGMNLIEGRYHYCLDRNKNENDILNFVKTLM